MPITFTQMLNALNETWKEQTHQVRVLAARYYVNAITLDELLNSTKPTIYFDDFAGCGPPLLTERQAQLIINLR